MNIMDKHKSTQIKQHWIKFMKNEQMDDMYFQLVSILKNSGTGKIYMKKHETIFALKNMKVRNELTFPTFHQNGKIEG